MQTTDTKPTKQTEDQAFIAKVQDARTLIDLINDRLNARPDAARKSVNWEDVGDAARVVEALKHAATILGVVV